MAFPDLAALQGRSLLAHRRLVLRRARHAPRPRRPPRGARPCRAPARLAPRPARLRPLLRQLDAHQVGLGGGGGPARHAAGDRGRWLDPGRPRRDGGGDRGHAGDERARPRHPPRPDPRRGEPLHARGEAGDRRLPRRHRRPARRPDRQPAVRRRPPHPDPRRPRLAARASRRRPRGSEDRGQLGLLAELRQAALGARRGSSACSPASAHGSSWPTPRATGSWTGRWPPPRPRVRARAGRSRSTSSMDEAFADADAVYPKSWGPRDAHAGAGRGQPGRATRSGWPTSRSGPSSKTPATATGSATSGGWGSPPRARRSTCTACPRTSGPR